MRSSYLQELRRVISLLGGVGCFLEQKRLHRRKLERISHLEELPSA